MREDPYEKGTAGGIIVQVNSRILFASLIFCHVKAGRTIVALLRRNKERSADEFSAEFDIELAFIIIIFAY